VIDVHIADGLRSIRLVPSADGATLNGEPVEGVVQVLGGDGELRIRAR
jgi:hypothetical protein